MFNRVGPEFREGGLRILHFENSFVTKGEERTTAGWGRRLLIFRRSNKEMHLVGQRG